MNKQDLVAAIATDTKFCTRDQVQTILDKFMNIVTEETKGGGAVTLYGFGTFRTTTRKPKRVKSPFVLNGETIAHQRSCLKFKPAMKLRNIR